jgi:hypothetical protein
MVFLEITGVYSENHTKFINTECPKSLESIGILIIFLNVIYRSKLKVKMLKMALTLDETVEIVLLSCREGWCMLLKSEIFVTLGRELRTIVLLSIPKVEQNPHKHGKAAGENS